MGYIKVLILEGKIIACPSCSRQNFNVIEVVNERGAVEDISDDIEVAIIGCYVNGPGESKGSRNWFDWCKSKKFTLC